MSKIVLTQEQIKELARFAAEDGQPSYSITTGIIPAFEADDGELVPALFQHLRLTMASWYRNTTV